MEEKIGENLCFQYDNGNSQKCQESYNYYKQHNPGDINVWGYNKNTDIFLDTNILLKTYFLSKFEKNSIVNFIKTNKERIVISSQVDKEYQKHRLKFISGYNKILNDLGGNTKSIIDACLKSINGDAIEKIKSLAGNHVLKYDFLKYSQSLNDILKGILAYQDRLKDEREKLVNSMQQFQEQISNDLSSNTTDVASMYIEDDLLQAISQCKILPTLSEKEMEFIKHKYDDCLSIYEKRNTDKTDRYQYAFPGCGDKKKNEDENRIKESDMIIYHEMLKYMKQTDKNIVFLTFDLKKGDWVPGHGYNDVFLHYIENQYNQTGHVIYIKSGDELPLMFTKDFEPIDEDSDSDEPSFALEGSMNIFNESFPSDSEEEDSDNERNINCKLSFSNDERYNHHKSFRRIDADRFLSELKTCSRWAKEYGAGYVGRDYFIYDLLGRQKHFEFNHSWQVYKKMIDENRIEEDQNKDGDKTIKIVEK